MFRNFTLHNKANGYLLQQKQEEILVTPVTQLAESDPDYMHDESEFPLEMNP